MNYWFTSDTHFSHNRIIDYCNRPFKNVEEMNRELINRWNNKVKSGDIVFHLGDFGFFLRKNDYTDITNFLNGTIIQIKGNHDNKSKMNAVIKEMIINHGGRNIFLTHIPEVCIDSGMDVCFCGHIHEKWKHKHLFKKTKREVLLINVGVDVWNFEPININDIIKYLSEVDILWDTMK